MSLTTSDGTLVYETGLISPIRPTDKILKSQIITVITVLNINFRENGLRIRTKHGQITLGRIAVFKCFFFV